MGDDLDTGHDLETGARTARAHASGEANFSAIHSGPERQLDPLTARVLQAFRKASVLQQQTMVRKLARLGSHPEEAICLRLLDSEEGISQVRLGQLMHRSRQWISKLLGSLESAGMVTRRPDDHDQRVSRVYLTPLGRVREANLTAVWTAHAQQTFGCLSETEQQDLESLLNRLVESIRSADAEVEMESDWLEEMSR
jgi:DNA-binding MarR family transcriptional regulator